MISQEDEINKIINDYLIKKFSPYVCQSSFTYKQNVYVQYTLNKLYVIDLSYNNTNVIFRKSNDLPNVWYNIEHFNICDPLFFEKLSYAVCESILYHINSSSYLKDIQIDKNLIKKVKRIKNKIEKEINERANRKYHI